VGAAVCESMVKVSWCCMVQSCTKLELLVKVSTPWWATVVTVVMVQGGAWWAAMLARGRMVEVAWWATMLAPCSLVEVVRYRPSSRPAASLPGAPPSALLFSGAARGRGVEGMRH